MEKMVWEKPEMNDIAFGANEYVAACGDGGTTYWFTCNAGQIDHHTARGGEWYDSSTWKECWCGETHLTEYDDKHSYRVYKDDNGNFGTQVGFNYSPCGESHEATVKTGESIEDVFFKGWMDDKRTDEVEKIEVTVWRGPGGDNCHCTSILDYKNWSIAYSG